MSTPMDLQVIAGEARDVTITFPSAPSGTFTATAGYGLTESLTVTKNGSVVTVTVPANTRLYGEQWALYQDGTRVAEGRIVTVPAETPAGQSTTTINGATVTAQTGIPAEVTDSAPTDGAVLRADQLVDPSIDLSGGDFENLTIPGVGTFPRAGGAGFVVLALSGDDAGIWTITATGPCIPADPQPRVGQLVTVIGVGQVYQAGGAPALANQATEYNKYPNLAEAGPGGFPAWADWTPSLLCGPSSNPVDLGTGGSAAARVLKVGTTCAVDGRIVIGTSPDFDGGGLLFLTVPYGVSQEPLPPHDLRSIGTVEVLDGSPSSASGIYTLTSKGGPGLQSALGSVDPIPADRVIADFDLRPSDTPTPTSFASDAPIDLTAGGVEVILRLFYETS